MTTIRDMDNQVDILYGEISKYLAPPSGGVNGYVTVDFLP